MPRTIRGLAGLTITRSPDREHQTKKRCEKFRQAFTGLHGVVPHSLSPPSSFQSMGSATSETRNLAPGGALGLIHRGTRETDDKTDTGHLSSIQTFKRWYHWRAEKRKESWRREKVQSDSLHFPRGVGSSTLAPIAGPSRVSVWRPVDTATGRRSERERERDRERARNWRERELV